MLFPRARKAFTSDLTFRIIPRHRRQDLVCKFELFGIAFWRHGSRLYRLLLVESGLVEFWLI